MVEINGGELGVVGKTLLTGILATWREAAAGGPSERRGDLAGDGVETLTAGRGGGDGSEEGLRVGVEGVGEKLGGGGLFNNFAGVHHHHTAGEAADNTHIVGDQEHSGSLPAQVLHKSQYFVLSGDIEGGCWFVGNEEFRTMAEGYGDHDTLLHTTGEFVGVGAGASFGIGNADPLQPLQSTGLGIGR